MGLTQNISTLLIASGTEQRHCKNFPTEMGSHSSGLSYIIALLEPLEEVLESLQKPNCIMQNLKSSIHSSGQCWIRLFQASDEKAEIPTGSPPG